MPPLAQHHDDVLARTASAPACTVEGCTAKAWSAGLCKAHYRRHLRRHGGSPTPDSNAFIAASTPGGKSQHKYVKEHLANLKASGNYARIVKEVIEEIAREQAAERAELERKAKAAQKADEAAKAKAAIDKAFRL